MSRRRHTPEQIITALREAEVGLANGKTVAMVSRELGISEHEVPPVAVPLPMLDPEPSVVPGVGAS